MIVQAADAQLTINRAGTNWRGKTVSTTNHATNCSCKWERRFLCGYFHNTRPYATYHCGLIPRTTTTALTVVLLAKNWKKWAVVVLAAAANRRQNATQTTKKYAPTRSKRRAQAKAQLVGHVLKAMPLTANTVVVLGWTAVCLEKLKSVRELLNHSQYVELISSAGLNYFVFSQIL